MKKNSKDILIIGFALFAMFFGAGNLIFPPFLGNAVGNQYIIASIGFICTGVGLPLLAIIAVSKGDGTFESMASRISPKFAIILTTILFIAIGPMLAIPRTAATTYELAVKPNIPGISPLVWMIIYFAINLIFVLKKSSIIDTIGTYLTPLLLILLAVIIINGIIFPIGDIMDALGGLLFAAMVSSSILEKGYSQKQVIPMTLKAGLVATLGLAFVYGGLMCLGAQTTGVFTGELTKSNLLLFISDSILGNVGSITIGLAMALACLSTSIGLLSAGASFFEELTKGKLSYNVNAIIISLISIAIGSLGVDKIVVISAPILSLLYPVAITLIFTTLFNKFITNDKAVRLAVYTSLVFGILEIIPNINLSFIPLGSTGFAWLIPTIIALIIGYIIFPMKKKTPIEDSSILEN